MSRLNEAYPMLRRGEPKSRLEEWKTSLLHQEVPEWNLGSDPSTVADLRTAQMMIKAQQERISHLENLAMTDELTGLGNRRSLTAALARELATAGRDSNAHGVLVLCDLDRFKSVNDNHGHAAGDCYLQAVAAALLGSVRSTDMVARLGGDEFAVLMPRTKEKAGLERATALEAAFMKKSMAWLNVCLPLVASFGTAVYGKGDIAEAVMASADLRLYLQKEKRKK